MAQKINVIRSTKAMNAANGRSCVRCGKRNGSTVRAHYAGIRQHLYGKGRGCKCHDVLTADLCDDCHPYFDEYLSFNKKMTYEEKIERSEEFLHCVVLTVVRDLQEGVLAYV